MRTLIRRISARSFLAGAAALLSAAAHAQYQLVRQPGEPPKAIPKAVGQPAPSAPTAIPLPKPAADAGAEIVTRYTLTEALAIARDRHPLLGALKASMNAALLKQRGLNEVKKHVSLFVPDIEQRGQQSDLGIQAAIAEYQSAEHEVTYAVVSCYFRVVYAREQNKVARGLVDQLEVYLDQVRKIVNSKEGAVPGINKDTEQKLVGVLGMAKGRLLEAETGTDRARATLREAMGLDPLARVDAADEMLPDVKANVRRDTVITHAVTRRGEVLLAQIGADVTRLEAVAQHANKFSIRVATFANAGDIHARSVPAAQREPDYKPGAIGPEMPDKFIGKRNTRTAIASSYADRADEAARQARSLVGLEADVAHSRFVEASKKVEVFKFSAKEARDLIDRQREAAGGTLRKEEILTTEVNAALSFANLNQALFEQILALSNLERITAGGVRVDFPGR